MNYALVHGGYIWRVADGWSGMVWRGGVPVLIPAAPCFGAAWAATKT